MDKAFDSLGAYRKLEESGMPGPRAGATVEVVKDAMQNLVTKEYLTAELGRRFGAVDKQFAAVDRQFTESKSGVDKQFAEFKSDVNMRFTKLETKMDKGFAELGRRQAWGFVYMSVFFIGLATLFLTAQQYFDGEPAAVQPIYYFGEPPPPPTPDSQTTEPANEPPPAMTQ